METRGSERRTTRSLAKKRKPLADLTNDGDVGVRLDASPCFRDEGGSRPAGAGGDDYGDSACPPTPVPNSAGDNNGGYKKEMPIIYTRRGKKQEKKKNQPTKEASCPPSGRSRSGKRKEILEDVYLHSKAYSVPYKKDKKLHLPQDFVKKQRAYFAEVDAHELLVEEVSESELD